jgi:predicted RNA-binding Zn-ribbon protein involved in translation (DUF1610 family)
MEKMRELGGVLKTLRHGRVSKKYCPKCGSSDIGLSGGFGFGFVPQKYLCRSCGYFGPIIMELEKEENQKPSA